MRKDSKRSREIFVMITNKCNLNCSYCYETTKNNQHVSPSKLKTLLSKEFNENRSHYDEFNLIFHGGEPFLSFKELKELSEWTWENFPELNVLCMATTNGTQNSVEIQTWLKKNKDRFIPILSIDGDRESHNLNRSNSYDLIDRNFFKKNWPLQAVKMTVNQDTLAKLFSNFLSLSKYGFEVNPSLAKEVPWSPERDLPILAREMKKMADYYVANPEFIPCPLINIPVQNFSPSLNIPHHRACGAGENIIAFDVNGNAYPCHAFIGNPNLPYNKPKMESNFNLLKSNKGLLISEDCKDCFIYSCCSPCYGLNYTNREGMGKFDPVMCEFNKVCILSAANMFSRMIKNKEKYLVLQNKTEKDLYLLLTGIKEVFNRLTLSYQD